MAPLGLLLASLLEIIWGILATLGLPPASGEVLRWILELFLMDFGPMFDGFGEDLRGVGILFEACVCLSLLLSRCLLDTVSSRRLCVDAFGNELS